MASRMKKSTSTSLLILFTLAMTAATLPAQTSRVFLGGVPTNMHVDWSQVATAPDPTIPNTFVAVMPLSAVSSWAFWEPAVTMDWTFGAGNLQQLVMTAVDWAYVTPDPCAHLPAPGASAPLSLLTSDFDYGPYAGQPGAPLFAGATYCLGSGLSYVSGLVTLMNLERWELRTRGYWQNELWNACPGNGGVTPSFSGFLGARFTVQ